MRYRTYRTPGWRRFDRAVTLLLALGLAVLLVWAFAPEANAAPEAEPDEPGVCEGTAEVLGHEWQRQTRTRDLVPEVVEVSHQVYAYKRQVETFRTEHEFKKQVRTVRSKGAKTELVHDWQWWSPASIKWRAESFTEEGLHGQWTDKGWKYSRTYRYAPTGQTRQVPDGHTWEHSGEVTEPRDAPWVLLPGYPRTEVTTEHVPAYYTPWTDWADTGDVVRTDEHTEPALPAGTDVLEHRWVYVGTYVRTEAVPPAWQDTDPEGDCYTGPTPEPTPDPEPTPTPDPEPTPDPQPPTVDPTPQPEPTPTLPPAPEPECPGTETECDGGDRCAVLDDCHDGDPRQDPTPEPPPSDVPTETPHDEPQDTPDELAETGTSGSVGVAILAVIGLLGAGAAVVHDAHRRKNRTP